MLHSALSWAAQQNLIRSNPIRGMRGPRRPDPRKHLLPGEIALLLNTAEVAAAADTGARRAEIATLRLADLDGQVLRIERNQSMEVLGPTKTGRTRRITIGATTAAVIRDHFDTWDQRAGAAAAQGDWIFAPDPRHLTHARADSLSHRMVSLRDAAGVPMPPCTGSATASPPNWSATANSSNPKPDPATTLRHYSRATPLDDLDIADEIDQRLNDCTNDPVRRGP